MKLGGKAKQSRTELNNVKRHLLTARFCCVTVDRALVSCTGFANWTTPRNQSQVLSLPTVMSEFRLMQFLLLSFPPCGFAWISLPADPVLWDRASLLWLEVRLRYESFSCCKAKGGVLVRTGVIEHIPLPATSSLHQRGYLCELQLPFFPSGLHQILV